MTFSLKKSVFSWFGMWLLIAGISLFLIWNKGIRFGIDLVGGTYLKLQVDTAKAVETELGNRVASINNALENAQIKTPSSVSIKDDVANLVFESLQNAQSASEFIKKHWNDVHVSVQKNTVSIQFTSFAVSRLKDDSVQRNIEVLRNRLDQMSVAEISIAKHGEKEIVIELPDVKDPQQAKAMIGKAAVLEFRLVHQQDGRPMIARSEADIIYEMSGDVPSHLEILPGVEETPEGQKLYYLVSRYPELTGSALRDAQAGMDEETGRPVTYFTMTDEGRSTFAEITGKNINRHLAIVLDNTVISAPVIQTKIDGSRGGKIQGSSDYKDVKDLALLLRSGSFVAPVTFEEEREIGPSLGAQAIRQGVLACLVGLGLLFLFSIYYYQFAGLLAFLALVFNVLLIIFGLSQLHATLTLPGIAGIVLTLGMAIDASILIFERIKEELRRGQSVRNAVSEGFSDAMTVILDANITTFIIGVVLYQFGTGPIQGFAVTMMLGIISTLLTGLFFLKSMFMFVLDNFTIQKLRI